MKRTNTLEMTLTNGRNKRKHYYSLVTSREPLFVCNMWGKNMSEKTQSTKSPIWFNNL